MTQQDTQPPAETLAEATNRLQFEADFQRKYGSARVSIRRDDADTILAALTRRAGGDAGAVIERAKEIIANGGPHEWGYRDPVDGTFIVDNFPFDAAAALALPAPVMEGDAEHVQRTELQEIADGAYGDGPAVRGAARDQLAALSEGRSHG